MGTCAGMKTVQFKILEVFINEVGLHALFQDSLENVIPPSWYQYRERT